MHFVNIKLHIFATGERVSLENRLKSARKKAGLTQDELAELAGISKRALVGYEKNAEKIQVGVLCKIAEICNISLIWILTGQEGAAATDPNIKSVSNGDVITYHSSIEAEHMRLVKLFKNKERAKQINEHLIELENIDESLFDTIEAYLNGVISGAKVLRSSKSEGPKEAGRRGGMKRRVNAK